MDVPGLRRGFGRRVGSMLVLGTAGAVVVVLLFSSGCGPGEQRQHGPKGKEATAVQLIE
jgi:hypothetical protein